MVKNTINNWANELEKNGEWAHKISSKAYYKIKESGLEDFSNFPEPTPNNCAIPISKPESRELTAKIFSDEACLNFNSLHPFIAKLINTEAGIPTKTVKDDINRFFLDKNNHTYLINDAVNLVAKTIMDELIIQVPRIVFVSKIILIIAFLIIQSIPFGLIGLAAYRNLKITS